MKGDRRKLNQSTMRQQTRELIAAMSDPELANVAIMNKQNLSVDPDTRNAIAAELLEEIARRKAAQRAGTESEEAA